MRDLYEVLRAKESLIEQLRREIEALRLAAPLLNDDRDNGSLADTPDNRTESDGQSVRSIKRSSRARLSKEADRERNGWRDQYWMRLILWPASLKSRLGS
ncbi:MAG: hypothetical protein DMG78_05080 [Acidobacteria bacterium]|nr:MAG: hypothetical protein DMG78_05080 [Acidobacteriota bacterium]